MKSQRTHRIRLVAAAVGAALLVGTMAGTAGAKEIGSGGTTTGGTTTCSPISNLTVKSDPKVGETGLALTQVDYGVKACTNGQVLTVRTTVAEYSTGTLVYDNPNASLTGRFSVAIKIRTTYVVTITAVDAATGTVAGSQSAWTAAVPKGV